MVDRKIGRVFMARSIAAVLAAILLVAGLNGHPAAGARGHAKPKATAAAQVPATPTAGMETQATHAFVIETETGTVLLDKSADERMPPASMSKIMTVYVVFDMLKQGRAKLEDELPVSERAWRQQGSKMFVPIGGGVKIQDLLIGGELQSR